IEADQERVCGLAIDADILHQRILGCDPAEPNSTDSFATSIILKVGSVKAKFEVGVELPEKTFASF
ncbi:MAG: carbon monoxide dehydrogenase, partial [Pseudomonadota bacterium]